jgi:hypothetical protein
MPIGNEIFHDHHFHLSLKARYFPTLSANSSLMRYLRLQQGANHNCNCESSLLRNFSKKIFFFEKKS